MISAIEMVLRGMIYSYTQKVDEDWFRCLSNIKVRPQQF